MTVDKIDHLTLKDIPVDLIQAVFHDDPADLTPEERAFIWELIQADLRYEQELEEERWRIALEPPFSWVDHPERLYYAECDWLTPEGSEEWEAVGAYPDYDMEDHISYPPPF